MSSGTWSSIEAPNCRVFLQETCLQEEASEVLELKAVCLGSPQGKVSKTPNSSLIGKESKLASRESISAMQAHTTRKARVWDLDHWIWEDSQGHAESRRYTDNQSYHPDFFCVKDCDNLPLRSAVMCGVCISQGGISWVFWGPFPEKQGETNSHQKQQQRSRYEAQFLSQFYRKRVLPWRCALVLTYFWPTLRTPFWT